MIRRNLLALLLCIGAVCASAGEPEPPPALVALIGKAGLHGQAVAWCEATLVRGLRGYAVALEGAPDSGRYVVLARDGRIFPLGDYAEGAELECMSAAEARKVDRAGQDQETVTVDIRPKSEASVICGFDHISFVTYWQYDPGAARFVRVGGWVT